MYHYKLCAIIVLLRLCSESQKFLYNLWSNVALVRNILASHPPLLLHYITTCSTHGKMTVLVLIYAHSVVLVIGLGKIKFSKISRALVPLSFLLKTCHFL